MPKSEPRRSLSGTTVRRSPDTFGSFARAADFAAIASHGAGWNTAAGTTETATYCNAASVAGL